MGCSSSASSLEPIDQIIQSQMIDVESIVPKIDSKTFDFNGWINRLNEVDKRKLISERLQLNLDRAIEFAIDDEAEKGPETKVVRKAAAKAEPVEEAPKTTKRKAAAVKIVSNSEGA